MHKYICICYSILFFGLFTIFKYISSISDANFDEFWMRVKNMGENNSIVLRGAKKKNDFLFCQGEVVVCWIKDGFSQIFC